MTVPVTSPKELLEPTPAELDELVNYAKQVLGHGVEHFSETGELPSHVELGGVTVGALRDARQAGFTRRFLAISRPSSEELTEARAWHDYCSKHGYPTGELCGADTAPGSKYPPCPLRWGEETWVGLTWTAVRRERSLQEVIG